jgi:hypothetical protein
VLFSKKKGRANFFKRPKQGFLIRRLKPFLAQEKKSKSSLSIHQPLLNKKKKIKSTPTHLCPMTTGGTEESKTLLFVHYFIQQSTQE